MTGYSQWSFSVYAHRGGPRILPPAPPWIKEKWREEIRSDPFYTQTTGGNSSSIPCLSRKDDILINQLKTGKTPVVRACLAFYKKKGRSERMCTECGVVKDVHLLIKCSLWGRERQIHPGFYKSYWAYSRSRVKGPDKRRRSIWQ